MQVNMVGYDTLLDLMLDTTWNSEGNFNLRRIVFKMADDGSLRAIRFAYGSAVPGASSWYEIDKTDDDAGYLYGKNLSDDDAARVEATCAASKEQYEQWRRRLGYEQVK